ncbi:ABC transporter permease [Streptomyces sp. NPDC050264]|uniref:ABC transporter permease n=1 Tax=Streptomyces sp. NPDC050264 TaxID=3155038 RepID=UPI00343AD0FC
MSIALTRPKGLTWTVLRLHQVALWAWIGYVAVAAGLLLWLWGPGTDGLDLVGACAGGPAVDCIAHGPTTDSYHHVLDAVDISLNFLPLAVAVFAGGVLTGRELERGTAQLAWTQSVSPARWLATRLTVPALLITAGTGLLVALRHAVASRASGLDDNQWYTGAFDILGPTAVALPLAALACGVLAALLLRRTLPGEILGFVLTILLSAAVSYAHPYLWSTRTRVGTPEQGYTSYTGEIVGQGAVTGSGAHIADPMCIDDRACITDHDITGFYTEGHPPSHFWPLQLVQTGLLLVLAGAITLLAFRILKRRTAS